MSENIRFFLVDDDADDVSIFKEAMQDVNPSVNIVSAGDGQEALTHFKT